MQEKQLVYTIRVAVDPMAANPKAITDAVQAVEGVQRVELAGSSMRRVIVEG